MGSFRSFESARVQVSLRSNLMKSRAQQTQRIECSCSDSHSSFLIFSFHSLCMNRLKTPALNQSGHSYIFTRIISDIFFTNLAMLVDFQ